ncbi:restriction endonuclease subunit S [Vagococcus fluvialis]|uniref:restriction endonuclease subunit S n=1 Tax=Vagococcus fluvialis TaxID=2738 RepID=UPI003D109792
MEKEKRKIPSIRFKGYTDDWEQRKLGEVFFQTSKYVNPKESNLELWSLTVENGLTPKTERYNREFLVKKEDQFKSVDHNEFIYNPMNMTLGAVDLNLTGKTVAVSGYYITMLSKDGFDSKYFSIWLKSPLAIKMYKLYATGSLIERQRVQFPTLSQIKSSVPQIEEQTKIGSFFKQLDDTIALHQRKLEILKNSKQTLLQKMFPQTGENVPEIRFPGFTEDWEQRKLGDVLTVSKEKNKSNYYSKEQVLSVSREVGTVNQIEYQGRSFAGANISGYKIVYPGQLIYTKSPLKGAPYGIFQLVTEEGIVSPLYAVYNSTEQALASFIGLQLKSDNIATHYLSPLVSKGAKNTINITDEGALDGRVTYPTITEQQKIVVFFKQLENTITLHQHELEKLKQLKQNLLNKLFV